MNPREMSSRLKQRGGAGGKIISSKPAKTLTLNFHPENPRSNSTPLAAAQKELQRPVSFRHTSIPRPDSAARPSLARSSAGKDHRRPISAGRASIEKYSEKSTSCLSKGKVTNFCGDGIYRISSFGGGRSFSGFRVLDKELEGKLKLGGKSSANSEKSTSNCKSEGRCYKGLKKVGCKDEELDIGRFDSHSNVKLVGGMVLESNADDVVLVEGKCVDENGHGNETMGIENDDRRFLNIDVKSFDNPEFESKETMDVVSKSHCETGGTCIDNIAVPVDKHGVNWNYTLDNVNYLNDLGSNSQNELRNTFSIHVKDVCSTANIYQSGLHEKLALLEGKVQKIALEIKQTKDLLDRNKPGKSRLVLSDIQKKVIGFEKAVDDIKEGAKFEYVSSYSGKFDDCVVSNLTEKIANSSPCIKRLELEELEARFFPHHRLMRNRLSSVVSAEQDKRCVPACSRMNGGQNIDGCLTDENPIALGFLTSLREEKPKAKKFDLNVQFTNDMVNKKQPELASSGQHDSGSMIRGQQQEIALESHEKLEEIGSSENNPPSMSCLGTQESSIHLLSEIGRKVSTGGWFVSGGEAVLLAHDDNSCSYYDISNCEVKSEYKAPAGFPSNLWGDCWLIRVPGVDGCSGQYVVAASAGNALESGFCSWDFYTKDVKALHVVGAKDYSFSGSSRRAALQTSSSSSSLLEGHSCWCRPCGPLMISTSSRQKVVSAYDIRDGDLVMTWEVNSPVAEMEYSSPLQWRNRGKVVIAEREAITLWDVNSLNPQPTLTVPFVGKTIYSLHVNNTDAEIGAGVRQRASSTEVEGNDCVLCTQDSVNVFDFRIPSGVGLKIPRHGATALSIFSRGDSIFLGSTEGRSTVRSGSSPRSHVEHFSLRKGSLVATYLMPEFNSHYHHSSVTQVWGNSNVVMGICGMGLFVFDAFSESGNTDIVKEIIGPDDLFRPTFDYMDSRVLVISRDRPAFWKYLL